jgi:anti-sigma factor RsiW
VSTAPGEIGCQELVELVTAYLDGAMSAGDAARFESHLAECDGCTIYVEQMRETISALGHLPAEALSPDAEHRLLVAFRDWRSRR